MPGASAQARVAELLDIVHLGDFAKRRPHELSGGMRQRVALARTLAQDTPVLLMDEPFGALDAMTRDILHDELERIWTPNAPALTVLFVTHNVREAARLADRIVLLSSRPGRVIDETPVDIARPRRIDSPEVVGARRRRHRPAARGGGPPWPLTPGRRHRDASPASTRWSSPASSRCPAGRARFWAATWPKLAALGARAGVWQVVVWSGWKPEYVLPGPADGLRRAVGVRDQRRALGRPR